MHIRSTTRAHRSRVAAALVLTGLLLFVATSALATSARLVSLGGLGDFLEDDRNVLRWYGSLGDYPNLITVDSGPFNADGYGRRAYPGGTQTYTGPGAATHVGIGNPDHQLTLALYLLGNGNLNTPGTTIWQEDQNAGLSLMVSRRIGSALFTASYHRSRYEDSEVWTVDDVQYQNGYRDRDDLGLGMRLNMGETAYLDLATDIRTTRLGFQQITAGLTQSLTYDNAGATNIAFRVRGFVGLQEDLALVPLFEYLNENRPFYRTGLGVHQLSDGRLWRLGCGLNYFPDADRLMILSVDYLDQDGTYSQEPTYGQDIAQNDHWRLLRLRWAMETRFLPYLSLRAALGYEVFCDNGTPEKRLPLSAGLALHISRWDLNLGATSAEPGASPLARPAYPDASQTQGAWLTATLTYGF